eukprot:3402922-Rhodomonas_salina.1
MSSVFCLACGTENRVNANFCACCGHAVSLQTNPKGHRPAAPYLAPRPCPVEKPQAPYLSDSRDLTGPTVSPDPKMNSAADAEETMQVNKMEIRLAPEGMYPTFCGDFMLIGFQFHISPPRLDGSCTLSAPTVNHHLQLADRNNTFQSMVSMAGNRPFAHAPASSLVFPQRGLGGNFYFP